MVNLDRFSRRSPEEYGKGIPFEECYCGTKVYNPTYWGESYCNECASEKIEDFRVELEELLEKHDMSLKVDTPNLIITYKSDDSTGEAF